MLSNNRMRTRRLSGHQSFEGLQHEAPVLLGRDREGKRIALPVELGQRDVLDVVHADGTEEAVNFPRVFHVGLAQHAEDVEFDFVLLEDFDAAHHAPPGPLSSAVDPVTIVHGLGAVNGDAHQPVIFPQQAAPVLVDQDSVGLQRVGYALAITAILF
jgi:hypothetical protein